MKAPRTNPFGIAGKDKSKAELPAPEVTTGENAVTLKAFAAIHRSKRFKVKAAHLVFAGVKREVRSDDVENRATSKRSTSTVDSVAGMLAPKLKDKRIDWRAAKRSAAAAWGKIE